MSSSVNPEELAFARNLRDDVIATLRSIAQRMALPHQDIEQIASMAYHGDEAAMAGSVVGKLCWEGKPPRYYFVHAADEVGRRRIERKKLDSEWSEETVLEIVNATVALIGQVWRAWQASEPGPTKH